MNGKKIAIIEDIISRSVFQKSDYFLFFSIGNISEFFSGSLQTVLYFYGVAFKVSQGFGSSFAGRTFTICSAMYL